MAHPVRALIVSLIALLPLSAGPLSAELVNCDGVWTNAPCSKARLGSMYEQPGAATGSRSEDESPAPFGSEAAREKEQLIRSLEKANLDARRKLGKGVDISVTRQICRSESTTVEKCKEAVLEKERQINELLLAAEQSAGDGTNVVVIDNRDDDLSWRHRRRHRPEGPKFDNSNVFPKPGNPNLFRAPEKGPSVPVAPGGGASGRFQKD